MNMNIENPGILDRSRHIPEFFISLACPVPTEDFN